MQEKERLARKEARRTVEAQRNAKIATQCTLNKNNALYQLYKEQAVFPLYVNIDRFTNQGKEAPLGNEDCMFLGYFYIKSVTETRYEDKEPEEEISTKKMVNSLASFVAKPIEDIPSGTPTIDCCNIGHDSEQCVCVRNGFIEH